jgi:hypothetical protein
MKNFLGIPVTGDINPGRIRRDQRPQSEFEPLVRALLDDDQVAAFGWRQYTPYFNDGEPCEFGAHGFWVRLVSQPESEDDDEDLELWGRDDLAEGTPLGDKTHAMEDAIDRGAFNDVLLGLFGDHAKITVTRTGISVDYYDHH